MGNCEIIKLLLLWSAQAEPVVDEAMLWESTSSNFLLISNPIREDLTYSLSSVVFRSMFAAYAILWRQVSAVIVQAWMLHSSTCFWIMLNRFFRYLSLILAPSNKTTNNSAALLTTSTKVYKNTVRGTTYRYNRWCGPISEDQLYYK